MKDSSDQKNTLKMLYRFNGLALVIPIIACLLVYLYAFFTEISLGKAEWRTVLFIVWCGTILVLLKEGILVFINRKNR